MCDRRRLVLSLLISAGFARAAEVQYVLTHDPSPEGMCWTVRMSARGLDPARRELALHLSTWGGWDEVDAYYVRGLASSATLRRVEGQTGVWRVELPDFWDGALEVSYRVPLAPRGSRVQARHGLLPWYDAQAGYANGFAVNTLMVPHVAGEPAAGRYSVELRAPAGVAIVSGWGGVSEGTQDITLAGPPDNAQILFGRPVGASHSESGGVACEVVQFGAGADRTAQVLPLLGRLVDVYGRSTGCPIDKPIRVFITDTGGGGTRVDRNFNVGISADTDLASPAFKALLAHEVFHEWLGGLVREESDEGMVWFKEGFTDYLALWHLAALGEIGPDWFAARLVELDRVARASEAHGHVSFGDPSVRWRDGDGPNEMLAYRGGAVLAFCADVELHRRGESRLPRVIADLRAENGGRYSTESVLGWLEANGLSEFAATHVTQPGLPDLSAALREVGFEATRAPRKVAYVGFATEGDELFGEITAVDPAGPAAAAGVRVGDRVTGFWPSRAEPVELDPAVVQADARLKQHPYGLSRIDAEGGVVHVGVLRDGREQQLDIRYERVGAGVETVYRRKPDTAVKFFQLEE